MKRIVCASSYKMASLLPKERLVHPSTSAIGVDLRVKQVATLFDGRVYEAINSFKKAASTFSEAATTTF